MATARAVPAKRARLDAPAASPIRDFSTDRIDGPVTQALAMPAPTPQIASGSSRSSSEAVAVVRESTRNPTAMRPMPSTTGTARPRRRDSQPALQPSRASVAANGMSAEATRRPESSKTAAERA